MTDKCSKPLRGNLRCEYPENHEGRCGLPPVKQPIELELESLRSQLAECQRERDELREESDSLTDELTKLYEESTGHVHTILTAREIISSLRSQLAQCQRENEDLRGKLNAADAYFPEAALAKVAAEERAESLAQQLQQIKDAMSKIIGLCAPGPNGSHHRLDKIFCEIHDIYTQAMYPEQVAASTQQGGEVSNNFRERIKQELIRTHVIVDSPRSEVEEAREWLKQQDDRFNCIREAEKVCNVSRLLSAYASHIRQQERERAAKIAFGFIHGERIAAAIRES